MASTQFNLLSIAALFVLLPAIASATFLIQPSVFISQSCKSTSLEQLCIKSLSPFANIIKKDDLHAVTMQSLQVTLSAAQHAHKRFLRIAHELNSTKAGSVELKLAGSVDVKVASALQFCVKSQVETVAQLRHAINITHKISEVTEENLSHCFTDADHEVALTVTYMSDCTKQWAKLPASPVKSDVLRTCDSITKFATFARDIYTNFSKVMDSKTKKKNLA